MKLYSDILHLGITKEMKVEDQKYTQLTNLLNLATIFIIALPAIILVLSLPYTNNSPVALIRFELLVAASILNLYLNKKGYYLYARLQTILAPLVLVFILNLFNPSIHEGMFLWMPYGIMAIGSFCFSIFSFQKERKLLITLILFFGLISLTYDNLLVYFSARPLELGFIYKYYPIYKLGIFFVSLMLYYNLYVSKRSNYQLQQELDYNYSLLQGLNDNLEKQILIRTKKIKEQNQHIKALAFTNSHQLRASIARIIGLSSIMTSTPSEEEKIFCIQKIAENVKEMDTITTDLSKKLVEEEMGNEN